WELDNGPCIGFGPCGERPKLLETSCKHHGHSFETELRLYTGEEAVLTLDQVGMDGFEDLVDDLLGVSNQTNAVVDSKPRPEVSALDLVASGYPIGLAQLLKDDPDFAINARDPKTGRSLLHEACARGDMEIVKFLLQKTEADLMLRTMLVRVLGHASSRDRFGCSPMHYVKSLSVAKLLVQYGSKVLDYNAVEEKTRYRECL
ncbi:hypothetical protein JG687_00002164, partial [Phytophthora cactorum]